VARLFLKVFSTPVTVIPPAALVAEPDVTKIGQQLTAKVRQLFNGSLVIRQVAAGSSNAEEEELKALSNAYYDIERFGISFTASPRHADMLMVTGPVSHNMVNALRLTYEAIPGPKIVVAVGDGAIDGGIFKGSYAIAGGVSAVIPVHFSIPGDPPTPRQILVSLLHILNTIAT